MKISKAMTETMTNSTAPSERLLYLDLSSVSERLIREVAEKQISNAATANEQLINEKIQAKNIFNNKINIIKDIRNYYQTETNNYNKKLSRYKNYINVAEITEKVISSIATTATSTSAALTGIGLPYSIPLRKVITQYIIAILLRSTLVAKKEQARLEMHYGFKQEDIMKEIERIFTNENKQSYDGDQDQFNSTE